MTEERGSGRGEAAELGPVVPQDPPRIRGFIHTLDTRGFGWIEVEDGTHYWFHAEYLEGGAEFDVLRQGDWLSFEPRLSSKGPRGYRVRVEREGK